MTTLLKVCRNRKGRDYVVGDVHGHLAQLLRQLNELEFNPEIDRLFFLGDVIDRGPDGEAVLSMIDQRTYWSVLGNHEAMMIAGFEEPGRDVLHRWNGGEWFYRIPTARQRAIINQVRAWPWAMEIDTGVTRVGLIHANVPNSSWIQVAEQLQAIDSDWQSGALLSAGAVEYAAQTLLWDRTLVLKLYSDVLESVSNQQEIVEFISSPKHEEWVARIAPEQLRPFQISAIDAVYMGHTFVPVPIQVGKCHFLDTYREAQGERLGIVCVSSA